MITIDELKAKLGGMKTAVDDLRDALSIEASEKRLAELEHQMTMPGFYDDQARSQKVISEMGEVKNKLERFGKLSTQYEEAETLLLMIEEENDPSLAAEGEEAVNGVEKSIDELQLMTMLNGEYDHNNAILTFHAGTGVEGQDGVVVVVLAVEHRHELQLVDGLLDAVDGLLTLGGQGRVVLLLDHEQQRLGLLILGGQLAEALELVLDLAHLADDLLAAGLVIVEAGHRHLVLQLGQALFAGLDGQCVAQVIHGGLHAAELCFQFVNRNHISFPSSHISWHKIT